MRTLQHARMHSDDIVALLAERGHIAYEGEGITQLQHAWQCGQLAKRAGAAPALQLAAWLHDVGHLMSNLDGTPTVQGIDDAHEHLAAQALLAAFGPSVSQPVALHVLAKQCLVTLQPGYHDKLSPDSIRSLALQGGPMSVVDAEAFLALPAARDALRLRAWDDIGKDANWRFDSAQQALDALRQVMAQVRAGG